MMLLQGGGGAFIPIFVYTDLYSVFIVNNPSGFRILGFLKIKDILEVNNN